MAPSLPLREEALRALLRRQVRAVVLLVVRLVACALLLTLLKPLWVARPWLSNLAFGLGALLCGVPLLREVARNWSWRIALGEAYAGAQRWEDVEAVLAPLRTIQGQLSLQGQLFDPSGRGAKTLALAQENRTKLNT